MDVNFTLNYIQVCFNSVSYSSSSLNKSPSQLDKKDMKTVFKIFPFAFNIVQKESLENFEKLLRCINARWKYNDHEI